MERLLLQGGAMVVFLLVGVLHPRVRGVALINKDLVLNLANGVLLFAVGATAGAWVAAHSRLGLVDMSWLGPSWAQFLVAFLALDFTRYWVHYADHRVPWLWTFHRVHHCAEYLDATTGLRMHLVDFVQLAAIPIVLFGVVMDMSTFAPWVVPAALGVGVVFDAFEHGNVAMDMDRPLNRLWDRVFNNPHFHSWHHTRDGHLRDGNYGNALTVWDRLFGTCVSGPRPPELYGIEAGSTLENSLLGWHLLRPRRLPEVAGAGAPSAG